MECFPSCGTSNRVLALEEGWNEVFHKNLTTYANNLIDTSTNDYYSRTMTYGKRNKLIVNLVTACWKQRFMDKSAIVIRRKTGKLQLIPEAQLRIEKRVELFLVNVARDL